MVTEETRQKYKKTIDEFCLMDDTFMSVVFGKDIKLAEMLLQIILEDDKIKVINFTFCSYYKLLYFLLIWCIITIVAAVAL